MTTSSPEKPEKPSTIIILDKEEKDEGTEPVILQDYLLKKGGTLKSKYQERYFILFRDVLWWKATKEDPNILGIIPLETLHFVSYQETKNEGKAFDFIVRSAEASHTFQLSAKTKEIAAAWVRELNKSRTRHEYRALKTRASGGKFWKAFDEVLPRVPPKSRDFLEKKLAATGRKSTAQAPRSEQNLKKITAEVSVLVAQPEEESDSSDEEGGDKKDDTKPRRPQAEKEEEQREIQRQLLLPSSRRMICQGLMSKKTKEHHKRVQFSPWHHRFFVLYDDRLEYYKNKGGDLKGSYPLSQIDGVSIPSEGTGFRFELLVKTSKHDKGRTVSFLTQSNTKLHEWVRAIKETLYIFHLKTGGSEGERKAKAMGVAPESLWEEWNYSFEKGDSPEENALERAAEEKAAAELRRLGAHSPTDFLQAPSPEFPRDRSTSDPVNIASLTLDPTIPFATTSGVHTTPSPQSPVITPSSTTSTSRVYFPEPSSSTPTSTSTSTSTSTLTTATSSPVRGTTRILGTIGEEVPSLDSPHRMLPSLRASLMNQRKSGQTSSTSSSTSGSGTSGSGTSGSGSGSGSESSISSSSA